jgi:hypothetical protein
MDPPATTYESPPTDRRTLKFVYASGSRPLEGYTVKRGVGQGGFGEIYYAVSDAGKEVALKLIRRNLDVELRGIRQCLNLKHPNLLDLYDIRQDEQGDTWVVMEYVPGESLETVLMNHPNGLPAEQALAWFHGIAAGVAYLHDRGIVHRDLKPANIFSSDALVKVGDYGLSKFISCSRRSGHTESIGTVHYMAPEVANGRYGKELDVYALGVMLYEMLTGRVPFDGESVGEVLMKHLTAAPDVSMLAEPYRSVVERSLEKDPTKRFASVGDMLAAMPKLDYIPPGAERIPNDGANAAGARRQFADTVVLAQSVDKSAEDPVLRVIREFWQKVRKAWKEANLPLPIKVVLIVAMIFLSITLFKVVVVSGVAIFVLAFWALCIYGIYRVVRAMVSGSKGSRAENRPPQPPPAQSRPPYPGYAQAAAQNVEAPAVPQPAAPQSVAPPAPRVNRAAAAPIVHPLVLKTPREKFTDLLGSMILSALAAVVMCAVVVLANSYQEPSTPPNYNAHWWAQVVWLALVGIAGSWAVLIPAKFWEGNEGDALTRRVIMMVMGMMVGAFACLLADAFFVQLSPHYLLFGVPVSHATLEPHSRFPAFYGTTGSPLPMAYLAVFGALFLVVRWWRQADPSRKGRLRLWSLIVSMVAALFVAMFLSFPQAWLPMLAIVISASVQLASPCVPVSQRYKPAKEKGSAAVSLLLFSILILILLAIGFTG